MVNWKSKYFKYKLKYKKLKGMEPFKYQEGGVKDSVFLKINI